MLQLYVWTAFNPDYTDGLAVALAHSEPEAQDLIDKYLGSYYHNWGILTVYPLTTPIGVAVSGGG
jgi:hypothetical protein